MLHISETSNMHRATAADLREQSR